MSEEGSPISRFYPSEFKTDLNGKKQEWEAVVLIPFIDEVKLQCTVVVSFHLLGAVSVHSCSLLILMR